MPKTEAQKKAVAKYNKAYYDTILLRVPAGQKEKIMKYVADKNLSMNAFIVQAINDNMITDSSIEGLKQLADFILTGKKPTDSSI